MMTTTLKTNPKGEDKGRWFKPAIYPDGIIICPLCGLPETDTEYQEECHCWDPDIKEER